MPRAVFLRMLELPPQAKGTALRQAIGAANAGDGGPTVYLAEPSSLRLVPGTPFGYWVSSRIRSLFRESPAMGERGISVQHGASSKNDFRFLRAWWEVLPGSIGPEGHWAHFAKGGEFSPFYADVHLVINWENEAQAIREYIADRYPYLQGETGWILHPENTYFRPGLTWPRRTTSGLSVRPLPGDCVFSDKGPAAFVAGDDADELLSLLGVMNSGPFASLVAIQLGAATAAARSYEVGLIQRTPLPEGLSDAKQYLASQALEAFNLTRLSDLGNEASHAFCLPGLVRAPEGKTCLSDIIEARKNEESARRKRLRALQLELDAVAAQLYGVPDLATLATDSRAELIEDTGGEEPDEEDEALPMNDASLIADLVQWCVGVAFGRWDLRSALDPSLSPNLQGPFDPLPVCPPGTLVGPDGLPARSGSIVSETWLRARRNAITLPEQFDGPATIPDLDYPLSIAWDGIPADDPANPRDLVAAVRRVLVLIWGDWAEAMEREACQTLGFDSLGSYLRDPRRGFFAFHIRRYSKSRRKAPIYWLLQSLKRNYGLWLYYNHLHGDSLFHAAREYVDPKVAVEESRLKEMQGDLGAVIGAEPRVRERVAAEQMAFVEELRTFKNTIDEVAMLELKPDLNDGVLLNIAPLHRLVPWKEAEKAWDELIQGKYEWSSIGKQLRQRGLVKGM